ncbi:site-specific integrase [Nocardia sp. NPDC049190]|uniref:site-specific integrase n=1 Tax=Nocardia sp. NPDC049190 TaxID=3155650 RepID=UPI0033D8C474
MLWHLLYESSARAAEVLMLDVPDLDTANRCAVVTRKRRNSRGHCLADRYRPVVASDAGRAPVGAAIPHRSQGSPVSGWVGDIDPPTGRARLSYRRAAELFENHTAGFDDGPYTLHQLRHSRLTHAAEDGASTPVLIKLSGHTSVRSLVKYARISDEGLRRYYADSDPATRRR